MMLLNLEDFDVPMKLVFELEERLKEDPERVRLAQALTLNSAMPRMGLRGAHGLFGSSQWWDNIRQGRMPLLKHTGVIQRAYIAGQEVSELNNTIDLRLGDGTVHMTGIFVNKKNDAKLFRVGCSVAVIYALDELKLQPADDGGVNYLKIALEMAVST
jgi:hypothetical protein